MITPKELGAFIANRRNMLGLTQKELAEKIHVTDKAISRWERGHGYPDIQTMEAIAEALYVSLPQMFGIAEEGNKENSQTLSREKEPKKEPNSIQQIVDAFAVERAKYQRKERFKSILLRTVIAAGILFIILYLCPWPKEKVTKTLYGETWEKTDDGEIITFLPYRAELDGYVLHYMFRGDYYLGDLELYNTSSGVKVFSCHFDGNSSNGAFANEGALQLKGDYYYHEGVARVTEYGETSIRKIIFYTHKDFSSLVIPKVWYSWGINSKWSPAETFGDHVRYIVRTEELSD